MSRNAERGLALLVALLIAVAEKDQSIQNAVSGAITSALAPVLHSLQANSNTQPVKQAAGASSVDSDNDDFVEEPARKKR